MNEHFIRFRDEQMRETIRVILYSASLVGLIAVFLLLLLQ